MRAKDIVIGESYRHKDHPTYCFAKAVKVLQPKEGENPHNKIIVKCEWSQDKDGTFGLIKYFSPADLMPNQEIEMPAMKKEVHEAVKAKLELEQRKNGMKSAKLSLAKSLAKLMVGNWVITGYKGNVEEAIIAKTKINMGFTIAELETKLENLTVLY